VTPFAGIPDLLLGPLVGRPDGAWARSAAGRWSPAQIVDHVAAAIELSARGFNERAGKPPMTRRPRGISAALAQRVVFATGIFGVRRRAPAVTQPGPSPERAATEARLRQAVQHYLEVERHLLPARARDLFLKHPVFGDLTLGEFETFHVRHAEHHARQLRERLA